MSAREGRDAVHLAVDAQCNCEDEIMTLLSTLSAPQRFEMA